MYTFFFGEGFAIYLYTLTLNPKQFCCIWELISFSVINHVHLDVNRHFAVVISDRIMFAMVNYHAYPRFYPQKMVSRKNQVPYLTKDQTHHDAS